jgi:Zn-dependent peptidase ImmA (M78 family)
VIGLTVLDLYKRAEKQGIEVDDVPMSEVISSSFPQGWIAIDKRKIETEREEKVHLAHEIGHIESGSFYNADSLYDIKKKHENHADKRAIRMLVPYSSFIKAVRSGIREAWSLAEHFDVTESFMKKVIDLYQDRVQCVG